MQVSKNQSLFEYLDELTASPRPSGLEPIVRYFPLKNNGQTQSKSEHVHGQPQPSSSTSIMSDYEDCESEIFSGPLTIEELRRASKLLRQKRAKREFLQEQQSKAKLESPEKAQENEPEDQKYVDSKILEAPPPSPREQLEIVPTTSEQGHVEVEQIIIQEFSLEEANFSGCNLSGLNLSFESGVSDPLAVEPTISKDFSDDGEDLPIEVDNKELGEVPEGLYTLACISDLAEKLTIEEHGIASDNNTELETTSELLMTPVKVNKHSLSHLYSPISPADLSSQYLDAIDESIHIKDQDVSKLPGGQVIDAIVSLQNQLKEKAESIEVSSVVPEKVTSENEEKSKQNLSLEITEEKIICAAEVVIKEDSMLQEDSLCNEEDINDVSFSLQSSDASARKDSSLMNDTIDEMDMILSMGVSYLETRDQNVSHAEMCKSEENFIKQELFSPADPALSSSKKYFCTPQMKSSCPLIVEQVSAQKTENKTPIPSNRITPAANHGPLSQKKYFPSPAVFKTPIHSKTSSVDKCASVGSSAKSDAASRVHVSTPFRVPKTAEPRSADFKHPTSRLPKGPRAINVAHITSPVSQYIKGPVVAPRIAVVHSKSPLNNPTRVFNSKMPVPKSRHEIRAEIENSNPNVPAVSLPYVNYDSASAIKVVEHKESKAKPLPNKIKKLMPSPGSVMRHTGRVNIPECVDGRQEVSILVSHDAF